VEFVRFEKPVDCFAVTNVQIGVLKLFRRAFQSLEIPRGVALRAKKHLAHIVVDADYTMALTVEVFRRFRADQTAATGYEYCLHSVGRAEIVYSTSRQLAPTSPQSKTHNVTEVRLPDFADFFAHHGIALLAAE